MIFLPLAKHKTSCVAWPHFHLDTLFSITCPDLLPFLSSSSKPGFGPHHSAFAKLEWSLHRLPFTGLSEAAVSLGHFLFLETFLQLVSGTHSLLVLPHRWLLTPLVFLSCSFSPCSLDVGTPQGSLLTCGPLRLQALAFNPASILTTSRFTSVA